MNRNKIAKINCHDMIKPCTVFYSVVFIVMLISIMYVKLVPSTKGNMGGIDMITIVFIFICGLCSFNDNFYFAKANSVSRKSFVQGLILSCIPIAFICSVIDFIINRVCNLFVAMPNIYDMCYGTCYGPVLLAKNIANWVPDNSVSAIAHTIMLQFLILFVVYTIGLVFASILYRCSKRMKAFAWIIGCIVFNVIFNVLWVVDLIKAAFGISTRNIYLGMLSLIVLTLISIIALFFVSRKAEVK